MYLNNEGYWKTEGFTGDEIDDKVDKRLIIYKIPAPDHQIIFNVPTLLQRL
jgi:hypothetical protein